MIEDETEDRYNGFINGMQTAKIILLSCDTVEQAIACVDRSINASKRLHGELADLIEQWRPKNDDTRTNK